MEGIFTEGNSQSLTSVRRFERAKAERKSSKSAAEKSVSIAAAAKKILSHLAPTRLLSQPEEGDEKKLKSII